MCLSTLFSRQIAWQGAYTLCLTHLDCVQDLDDARVPQGAEFPKGVLCQWKSGSVGRDIEGEDATLRIVFLEAACLAVSP